MDSRCNGSFISFLICAMPQQIETFCATETKCNDSIVLLGDRPSSFDLHPSSCPQKPFHLAT
ncbi:hypothetical protein M5D96_013499, partial [Drosophila gunungcola]